MRVKDWTTGAHTGARNARLLALRWVLAAAFVALSAPRTASPATHYRSIGTKANYLTGSVTVTNGSAAVTGVGGTLWADPTVNRGRGDYITITGQGTYTILQVNSNTSLTLTANFTGTSGTWGYVIGRKFTTIDNWRACIDTCGSCGVGPAVASASLVADNRLEVGVLYKDSVFTGLGLEAASIVQIGALSGDNSCPTRAITTDATRYVKLTADGINRHYGVPGAGVVIDGQNQSSKAGQIRVWADYTRIEWVEIKNVCGTVSCSSTAAIKPEGGAANLLFQNLMLHDNSNGIRSSSTTSSAPITVRNSIFYNNANQGIDPWGTNEVYTVENCTFLRNGGAGITRNTSTVTVRNTISLHNAGGDFAAGITQSYNRSADASATGAGSLTGQSATDVAGATANQVVFKNCPSGIGGCTSAPSGFPAGTEGGNYRLLLKASAINTAVDSGTDLSGSFQTDIENQLRPAGAAWDIGADELASPTVVSYSVGTSTANLRSSAGLTMTISSGTATFSEPQANNIGVGDKITYNGSTVAYISGRSSSTSYSVITGVGATPPDVVGATVDSIRRAFDSLTAANAGSADAAHLNLAGPPYDLVAANVQLNWPCYNDEPMNDRPSVSGWTTGLANYIRIYAPFRSDEVGSRQRHWGVAGSGFRLTPVSGAPAAGALLLIDEEYVRVEGIEIDGAGLTNAPNLQGIYASGTLSTTSDVRIDGCIIHDLHDITTVAFHVGIWIDSTLGGTGASARISNNLVYDITNPNYHVQGISVWSPTTSYVYNNTVYNIKQTRSGSANGAAWGIQAFARSGCSCSVTVFAKNNYVGDVIANVDIESCYDQRNAGAVLNKQSNVSSDGTGNIISQSAYPTYFVNATVGSENLHLLSDSNALWGSYGTDLDGDPNLPVTQDVDGGMRSPTQPDIGADEFGNTTDLAITKDDFQATAVPGTGVTYTITVTNDGPAPVTGATVTDNLPASLTGASWTCVANGGASCTAGPVAGNINDTVNLPVGGSLTYTLTATIAPGAASPLDNTATVTPPGGVSDFDTTNNSDTDSDMLTPQAELEIAKAVDINPASLGDVIKYTLSGRNNGPSSASVTLLDDLPLEVAFDSATPPCSYSLAFHRVTCALGTLGPAAPYSVDIFVRTVAGGMIRNEASVYSPAFDSNLSNNAAAVTSSVDVPTDAIRFFTVTSTSGRNRLEWVYPTGFNKVRILYNSGPATCVFPADPVPPGLDGTPIDPAAGTAGEKDFHDHTGVNDTWKYCYTIFVERSFDVDYGPGRSTAGRPFDSSGLVKWAFSVGATALAPPGIGMNAVHAVAHDNGLHAMEKAGVVGEEGTWPPGWKPVGGNLPFSQGRPTTIASSVAGPARVVFLGSQDQRVYAINADAGDAPVQMSADLGEMVLAQPSGMFSAFPGGDRDHIFVGTRRSQGELYALRASDLSVVPGWPFTDGGGPHGKVGPILSQASVVYGPPRRVYFTSKAFNPGGPSDNHTVWCLDITALPPTPPSVCWSQAIPNVATSPTVSGNRLYVGTSDGKVHALDLDNNGAPVWTITTGDGPVLGFVVVDRPTGDLYFATTNLVWGFLGDGSPKWGPLGSRPITRPSVPVMLTGTSRVYVGGDGVLHGLKASDGTEDTAFPIPLGDGTAKAGSVTIDTRATPRHLYVGTEAGIIYAVEIP